MATQTIDMNIVTEVNYNGNKVKELMLNSVKIWPINHQCIFFKCAVPFTLSNNGTKTWNGTIETSINESTWTTWDPTVNSSVSSSNNGLLYVRGTGNTAISGYNAIPWTLTPNDNSSLIDCYGNIENLLDYQTVALGNHPTAGYFCYRGMFASNQYLRKGPDLEGLNVGLYGYGTMFIYATGLQIAPKINATSLDSSAMHRMFYGCTNLNSLPSLKTTGQLPSDVYKNMFEGCSKLKLSETQTGDYINEYRIPQSGTATSGSDSVGYMFFKTSGTFTGSPSLNTVYYTSNRVID